MTERKEHRSAEFLFFKRLIRYRWLLLITALAIIGGLASQLGNLKKNTSADGFISESEPALIYRKVVENIFNLKDPLVIAVQSNGASGIYNDQSLRLVQWLSDQLISVPNIDPQGITSLATESNIQGDSVGMEVRKFLDGSLDRAHIGWIKDSIENFPLYRGTLVSDDGSMTLIVAELLDQDQAEATYQAVLQLIERAPEKGLDQIHVAGEGAISGYLSEYIDRDAKRLNPLAGIIITIVLIIAFFTPRAAIIPNLIVAGTVAGTLGAMAASGADFYVITNGLIVCMIGIAVADSIHIFSDYYETLASSPAMSQPDAIATAMARMWRPVTLTTLTTAAGFLALYPTNDMPPLQDFGIFGAIAVLIAGVLTLFVTPSLLSFVKARPSRLFRRQNNLSPDSRVAKILSSLSLGHPGKVLFSGLLIAGFAVLGASNVVINEERIENFQHHEPIYVADKAINAAMDGTYHLDVVIETPDSDGIYMPAVLEQIEELQRFLELQPEVHGTTSIADYIKQMNRAVNEDDPEFYVLPDNKNLIAQLFLLYTASGDPTDFEERIDSHRKTALVRASLKTGSYQASQSLIPKLEHYLSTRFGGEATAHISGRINVDYHWIDGIAESHLKSVAVSFLAVFLMSALLFRSLVGGLMAAIPVGLSILVIYAVMGVKGIWLGVGTSMFAAIAIGLSVDFAIHTIDRLREAMSKAGDLTTKERISSVFASTGRALWFNLLAVSLGFGVLMTSHVPPLVNFGMLVALSVSVAFVASLLILPAITVVFKPGFLLAQAGSFWKTGMILLALLAAIALTSNAVAGEGVPAADTIIKQMNNRPEGVAVQRDMVITLTDHRGNSREERTSAFRRYFGNTKKTAIFYTHPATVAGTAFLTWDYENQTREDDQWLYLPALRKVRRVSASDRGDYFLGTDFTYEEIKKESKIAAEDYRFEVLGTEEVDGQHTWKVEATPINEEVSRALGYGKVVLRIDSSLWIPRLTEYWDVSGNFLKTVRARSIEKFDGIWAITDIEATNKKTGHKTRIQFHKTDYGAAVPPRLFDQNALKRGY
ncbi:outer membrane lipoprotein-sorting protein [Marinobacter maritimus]|uniref:outer membrane lipoprotein-sorting protein n=1 Tax=Marinobacter maritimus TaxID=277961 RepID=UPI00119D99C7|nr:outer membrane lipoprotein-sorting protein [Marinobacter maritimus]